MDFTEREKTLVKLEAEAVIKKELFDKAVLDEVNRIKTKVTIWDKLFPYKIVFIKK